MNAHPERLPLTPAGDVNAGAPNFDIYFDNQATISNNGYYTLTCDVDASLALRCKSPSSDHFIYIAVDAAIGLGTGDTFPSIQPMVVLV